MSHLHDLVSVFGVVGALVLIAVLLGVGLLALYLILHFGETSIHALGLFVREMLAALRYEPRKTHVAIRLELHFQRTFLATFLLSFGAILLHALVPFMRKQVEDSVSVILVTSFVFSGLLALVSIKLSMRLP